MAYNAFDVAVFQLADCLKDLLSLTDGNSMVTAAAVIMCVTPIQH